MLRFFEKKSCYNIFPTQLQHTSPFHTLTTQYPASMQIMRAAKWIKGQLPFMIGVGTWGTHTVTVPFCYVSSVHACATLTLLAENKRVLCYTHPVSVPTSTEWWSCGSGTSGRTRIEQRDISMPEQQRGEWMTCLSVMMRKRSKLEPHGHVKTFIS